MTKTEAFRILRIANDINYTYTDGAVNFMTLVNNYKSQAEADMRAGTYPVAQATIDEAYNYLRDQYNAKTTGARSGSGASTLVSVLVGAGAVVLAGALITAGVYILKDLPKKYFLPDDEYTVDYKDGKDSDRYRFDEKDYTSYMGDLTDKKEVTQRAKEILQLFNQNGIVHSETNTSYTVEEINIILQYMNGGILPEGVSPETANTCYLNMIADMFNTDIVIYNSAYMTGAQIIDFDGNGNILDFEGNIVDINHIGFDKSTGLNIIDRRYAHLYSPYGLGTSEQHYRRAIANYVPIDVTDFQFGDSTAYPYLEWFSAKYNRLVTTIDKTEKIQIFNDLTQSLADIVYGNGYQMKKENGETVLIQYTDFADYDDVNDYNGLRILVSLYQSARSIVDPNAYRHGQTKDTYRIVNNGGVAQVYIDDVLEEFNAVCVGEDEEMHIYDENGIVVDGDNLDQRAYSNTVHLLEENIKNGNLNYWEEHFSLSK